MEANAQINGNTAIETVQEFWKNWSSRNPDSLKKMYNYFHPDIMGFGTEIVDKWICFDDVQKYMHDEVGLVPAPVDLKIKEIYSKEIGDFTLCLTEMRYKMELPAKCIVFDPVRVLHTMTTVDGEWKMAGMGISRYNCATNSQIFIPALAKPKWFEEATVLFADFENFTTTASIIPPNRMIAELDEMFCAFDDIVNARGIVKVKTIGDAYMAVSGISKTVCDHACASIQACIDFLNYLKLRNLDSAIKWNLRIGMHSGPVIAGMIGKEGLQFDLWGDTVNIASHIQKSGAPGQITLSAITYDLIKNTFDCEYLGKVHTKGKGPMDLYYISGNELE